MAHRPEAVVFDVNETLFSFDALRDRFVEHHLPSAAVDVWFARTLRDGFATAATGTYAPFRDIAAHHLGTLLAEHGRDNGAAHVGAILAAFSDLEPHPDVEPALHRLRDAGIRCATLTVGDADITRELLRRAGLESYVSDCLSAAAVRAWKPDAEPYRYAVETLGVPTSHTAMVAVHSWDVHGARRAGLATGYASRLEGRFIDIFDPPDVFGETLLDVVDGLLALATDPGWPT